MTIAQPETEKPERLLDSVYKNLGQSGGSERVLDPVRLWIGARWASYWSHDQVPTSLVWTPVTHGRGWTIQSVTMTGHPAPSASKVLGLHFGARAWLVFGWPLSSGPIGEQAPARLIQIAPDLAKVVAVMATLKAMASASTDPKSLIETISRPVGLLTGTGQVIGWNHAASILASKAGASLPKPGGFAWASECRRTVRHGSASCDVGKGLAASLTCLRPGFQTSSSVMGPYMLSTVIAVLTLEATDTEPTGTLTGAEKAVFDFLQAGLSVADIAEARGTSIETIRQQIKRLRTKLGRHSIAGLASIDDQAGVRS